MQAGPEAESRRCDIALVLALAAEMASLQAALNTHPEAAIVVMQSGPGADRAARTARQLVDQGARGLISWGLAGGLEPQLGPGSVLVPKRVIGPDGTVRSTDLRWQGRLVEVLGAEFEVHEGDLLGSLQVLESPRQKARLALACGGAAVDMESAAIGGVAVEASVPFVVLRVVADCLIDTLPRGVSGWVTPDGQTRLAPVLAALLRPSQWGPLARLATRYRAAHRTLDKLALKLVPAAFEYPPLNS